jgi:guanine deaminase
MPALRHDHHQDMLTLYPFEDRHLDAVMQAYEQIGIRVVFSLQYA